MSARQIIATFGGQARLAEALETRQSTVQHWAKTNHIPNKWHRRILDAAIMRNIAINPDSLPGAQQDAALTVPELPEVRWPGKLEIGDETIPCYVLSDGRRVITRRAAADFLTDGRAGGNLESYLGSAALLHFLPRNIEDHFFEIKISNVEAKTVKAMTAESFIIICQAFARARDTGALLSDTQVPTAIKASMLLSAFAKNGIEAAIDEATGYQYERASDALKVRLAAFLEDEMRAWEPTFPNELWIQFGRLTKWDGAVHQRPKYWGKLVMELIYGYLDPDVAEWLKKHAPTPRHGQNYHQWLSAQFGLKKLIEHIWLTIGMATACRDMSELRQRMAEKFGRQGIQFTLYLPSPNLAGGLGEKGRKSDQKGT